MKPGRADSYQRLPRPGRVWQRGRRFCLGTGRPAPRLAAARLALPAPGLHRGELLGIDVAVAIAVDAVEKVLHRLGHFVFGYFAVAVLVEIGEFEIRASAATASAALAPAAL